MATVFASMTSIVGNLAALFAYSGNRCALPNCKESLVDVSGTMLGKVAHIAGAEKGSARFDANMSGDARRRFENLILVCGKHHDIIDDPRNVPKYSVATLTGYKDDHERRFQIAERQLLEQYSDSTARDGSFVPFKRSYSWANGSTFSIAKRTRTLACSRDGVPSSTAF